MNTKQQLVTGILALVIVGSVALMPVNAGHKAAPVSAAPPSATMTVTLNSRELPQEEVKDLTYN